MKDWITVGVNSLGLARLGESGAYNRMPYIKDEAKVELAGGRPPRTVGELNYAITRLMIEYCHTNLSYGDINDVIGAVEGAKLEFYRRMAIPYEEAKILENGDVYTQIIERKR